MIFLTMIVDDFNLGDRVRTKKDVRRGSELTNAPCDFVPSEWSALSTELNDPLVNGTER